MPIVTLKVGADGVAVISLDDPSRPANVTSPELTAELLAAIDRVAVDDAICGAVIASGKPGRFIAGGDIKDFVGAWERRMSEGEAFELSHRWNRELRRIERCGKPFAAAINGAALGGGFELALMCQHRVLVDDPKAVVGLVEVGIGLLPAGGGSQRLPRLIGIDAALRLMVDARRLAPREALAAGLVHALVPAERLVEQARAWVRANPKARQPWEVRAQAAPDIAQIDVLRQRWQHAVEQRFGGHYPAPQALLNAVFDGVVQPLDDALRTESRCFAPLLAGVVARNLMRTGFVYRQQADKRARQAAAAVPAAVGVGAHGAAAWAELDGPSAGDPNEPHLLLWPSRAQPMLGELVTPAAQPAAAIEAAFAQAGRRGVTPVLLPVGQPSFVRRLHRRWRAEAQTLRGQGFAAADIEASALQAGLDPTPWRPWAPAGGGRVLQPLQQALLRAAALEGAQALAEGAIASAADADLASVLGAGCPAWTGGVISLADAPGLRVCSNTIT